MGFYIVTHILLGAMAGNAAWLLNYSKQFPSQVPVWFLTTRYPTYIFWISIGSAVLSIPTTLVQWGFMWSLATIGELLAGVFLVGLIPFTGRILLLISSIPLTIVIMGALWGLWYI